jgi:hypothetical protein
MIRIGTVHLNGREYSLELNRVGQSGKDSEGDSARPTARKNLTAGRSKIVLLNTNKKSVGIHHATRPNGNIRPLKELRRVAAFTPREQAHAAPVQTKWQPDRERVAKPISRFLSWCFPLREFNSPLQRILDLSVEEPKPNYRRRVLLP